MLAYLVRKERPIPNTHALRMTVINERADTGNPENCAMTIRMPMRIRMLERDINAVYQGITITTNSPRTVEGCAEKCVSNSFGVPEIISS